MTRVCQIIAYILSAVLLFSGCGISRESPRYCLPRRDTDTQALRAVLDQAEADHVVSAPRSGENRQPLQKADLDGDGREEYLLFLQEKETGSLKVLLFSREGDRLFPLGEILQEGALFASVSYGELDGRPGMEVLLDSCLESPYFHRLSVYSLGGGSPETLLSTPCTEYFTVDLVPEPGQELLTIVPGKDSTHPGSARLYDFSEGTGDLLGEASLSEAVKNILQISFSPLSDGSPALLISGSPDQRSIRTDILTVEQGVLTNLSARFPEETLVSNLGNHYLFPVDIDGDGIMELPEKIPMRESGGGAGDYLIRWFSLDSRGNRRDKLETYHNFEGGWYLSLGMDWPGLVSVRQEENAYVFSIWDEAEQKSAQILSVLILTGDEREAEAARDNRFILRRTDQVLYCGRLETSSARFGITEEGLIRHFDFLTAPPEREST